MHIEYNDTAIAIDRVVAVGTDNVRVAVAANVSGTPLATVEVESLTIVALGQRLVGGAAITRQASGAVRVQFTNADVTIGGGLAVLRKVNALVEFGPSGLRTINAGGTLAPATATGTAAAPALAVGGAGASLVSALSASVTIDTTGTTPYVRLSATSVTLTLGSASLSASIDVEAVGASLDAVQNAQTVHRVAVRISSGTLTLGAGTVTATASTVHGWLLLGSAGAAGSLSGSISVTEPFAGFSVTATTVSIAVNTRTTAVNETLAAGDDEIAVQLPAGPYVRFELVGASITVGTIAVTADLVVEQRTIGADTVLGIAAANVGLSLGGGRIAVTNGSGLVVIGPGGAFADVPPAR